MFVKDAEENFVAEFGWTSWTVFFFFFFYHVVFAFPEKSVLPLLDFSVLILTFSVKL